MDANGKDDLKTQFATREGVYRLMTLSEYSRPNRVGYQTNQNNPQVRVSLVSLPMAASSSSSSGAPSAPVGQQQQQHYHQQHHQHHQSHYPHHHLHSAHGNNLSATSSNASSVTSTGIDGGGVASSGLADFIDLGGGSGAAGGGGGAAMRHHRAAAETLIQSPSLITSLGNGGLGRHHAMADIDGIDGSTASTTTMLTHQQLRQQQFQHHRQGSSSSPTTTTTPSGGGGTIAAGAALLPLTMQTVNGLASSSAVVGGQQLNGGDRICFNYGKELYVYAYRGCKKLPPDLSKPVDKKLYKGTNPSCHDFNETVAQCDGAPLLVGFTTGQIQLVQPGKREPGRLFNEERFIDKTKVTCLKWLPGSSNHFLAAHASGHLYLYNEDLPCTPATPTYAPLRSGDGFAVHACKAKQPRNPLHRWTFTTTASGGAINEMAFSPCGQLLAIVSQDGFLRVFDYERQELLGVARSYFGGFLCVCWSPDGKYIVVGGEDDLVTVWSVAERRVVARGQGHRSWVSVVAFDPYTSYTNSWDGPDFSDDENPANDGVGAYRCFTGTNANATTTTNATSSGAGCGGGASDDPDEATAATDEPPQMREHTERGRIGARPMSSSSTIPDKLGTSYRLGSVSQDTQLCLWDITEDVLRQSHEIRQRLGSHDPPPSGNGGASGPVAAAAAAAAAASSASAAGATTPSRAPYNHHPHSVSGHHSNSDPHSLSRTGGNKLGETGNSSGSSATASSHGGLTAFTSLTQRLTNFSFGSGGDSSGKKSASATSSPASTAASTGDGSGSHKKSFTFSKGSSASAASNHHQHHHQSGASNSSPLPNVNAFFAASTPQKRPPTADASHQRGHNTTSNSISSTTSQHTNAVHNSSSSSSATPAATDSTMNHSQSHASSSGGGAIVPSYDPLRLIGTAVCPRFDECPLLEPLVCKKIAHERLTALIFREDCFLTACQDGLVYTWARPGFSNMPQHLLPTTTASSPNSPSSGTVV